MNNAIEISELFERKQVVCDNHGKTTVFTLKDALAKCELCRKEIEEKKERIKQEKIKLYELETRKRLIESNFNQAMIPVRFQNHSFETYEAKTKEQIFNKEKLTNYAKNFDQHLKVGASVMLCGKVGTGKTHLACAVANYVIKNLNKTALFLNTIDAFSKIKGTYSKKSEISEIDLLNQFGNVDLLIIDEFGVQNGTEHEKLLMFRIINKRYENLKPTILISNLSGKEIRAFEERIYDRMKDGGFLLTFLGDSQRKALLT